jgi:lipoprotein-anchoring transpeptidase ErfK/SrfK
MFDRRAFCSGGFVAMAAALSGCSDIMPGRLANNGQGYGNQAQGSQAYTPQAPIARGPRSAHYDQVYAGFADERYPVTAFDYTQIDPQFLRRSVAFNGPQPPGSIVIDTTQKHLFFVEAPGRATRYGVGVGREGFAWSGGANVNMKRDWPDWVPPAEMIQRSPEIVAELQHTPRGLGVPGGPKSPLGARAMYLFADGRDLGYRIHGTLEPETIGSNVSSGCIRLINQDIVHLYTRAAVGTPATVLA